MALLESNPLIGLDLPHFELPDVFGQPVSTHSFDDKKAVVIVFICAHCPYVLAVEDRLLALGRKYANSDVQFVAICSNDFHEYPDDHPDKLRERHELKKYPFPYLVDESQTVAKEFDAVCTPDIYVFNQERKLAYHGRIDDSWKDPAAVTQHELLTAIEQILSTGKGPEVQYPTMGCSIKWRNS